MLYEVITGIALMILVIALFNYMNIFTVTNVQRSKEMAVRKIAGMKKNTVFAGFIFESILFVGMAMILAIGLSLLSYNFV